MTQNLTSLVLKYMVQHRKGLIQDMMNTLGLVEAEFTENKLVFYTSNIYACIRYLVKKDKFVG